jgi:hypothetical protein
MFYGFHTGRAAISGCRVEHVLEDIQSLNRRALERADLEITAVPPTRTPSSRAPRPAPAAPRWHGLRTWWGRHQPPLGGDGDPRPLTTAARFVRVPDCVRSRSCSTASAAGRGRVRGECDHPRNQLTYRDEELVKVVTRRLCRAGPPAGALGLDVVRRDPTPTDARRASASASRSGRARPRRRHPYALQFDAGSTSPRAGASSMYGSTLDLGQTGGALNGSTSRRAPRS